MSENYGEDQLYIPQVADDQKPKYGMEFSSIDETFSFYNQYARESGFSARINSSKKNKITNEVVWKMFVCFKEGHTDDQRNKQAKGDQRTRERTRGEVRTGCKSKISLVKKQTGSAWVVTNFTEGHNHPLSTPSKVHLLRSHRNVSAAKKALTQRSILDNHHNNDDDPYEEELTSIAVVLLDVHGVAAKDKHLNLKLF
ncbi:protein FAR1-RELATED SEQUENCE 5-like [Zingiber officinale]|uniref:protein FAR1-RELATED SEQUENCE 5-like n=1 Tax=Zingiber officinale TaxID=94328 RepID=UPI001C4BAEDF|nr:protein FAR1-RELATED SEQUENCE 5-like [Zingiber officinale]